MEKYSRKILFLSVFAQLLFVKPVNIIYGNFLSSLVLLPFFIYIFSFRRRIVADKNNLFYVIFTCYLFSSFLWSPIEPSLHIFLTPILTSIFLVITYNLIKLCDGFRSVMWAFVAVSFVNLVIYLSGNVTNAFFGYSYFGFRFQGTFLNPNGAGFVFIAAMIFSIVMLKEYQSKLLIFLCYLCLFSNIILVFATISKKCIFVLPIILLLHFLYNLYRKSIFTNVSITISIWFFVILIVIYGSQSIKYENFGHIGQRFEAFSANIMKSDLSEGTSTSERIYFIRSGLNMVIEKPLFGYGGSSFAYYHSGVVSHNNYVEIIFNGGIFAFFIFYFRYYLLVRKSFFLERKHQIICVFSLFIIFFLEIGSITYNSKPFLIFFLVLWCFVEEKNKDFFLTKQL
jgi:O-antigen ligase